jgi:hypothetical protein
MELQTLNLQSVVFKIHVQCVIILRFVKYVLFFKESAKL